MDSREVARETNKMNLENILGAEVEIFFKWQRCVQKNHWKQLEEALISPKIKDNLGKKIISRLHYDK